MSFILDALKKSEIERQRQAVPGLMESGTPPPRPRFPLWAVALVALLAINLAVLAIVLTRNGAPAPAPTSTSTSTSTSTPAPVAPAASSVPATAPPAPRHFSPLDAPPVYAPEIPADAGPAASAPAAPPAVIRAPPALNPPAPRAAPERDPTLTANEDKADQEVLPTINELSLAGRQALPDLHLDVHVFATKPAERFVYINMRKYHEGSTLAEGPLLERIRRDGVVLNFQGVRFVLPRQQ